MDFRSPIRWRHAACLALAALAPPAIAAPPAAKPAAVAYVPQTNCKQARALPAEADAAARRVACEIPPEHQADVSRAEVFGALLRRHDLAAWLTSDALVAAGAMRSIPGQGLGWLTQESDGRIDVRYFSRDDGRIVAFAESSLPLRAPLQARDTRALDPPQAASERERRLLAAITLAKSQKTLHCADAAPNTVAVEYAEPGQPAQILVFLMSPWNDEAAALGGHALLRISRDGGKVLDRFEQTRRCVNIPIKDVKASEALTVSHLTSPTPTYFHAFMSKQYAKPIVVLTVRNGLVWKVEDGRVRLLADDAPESKTMREAAQKSAAR